jgi:hypothetical protein
MLNRVSFGYDQERCLMFASPDKVDRHWQSDVLTGALKKLTQELSPQPFGVQIYRQLSIAATERHVKESSRPFDLNDDKSTAADIEVVFAWQSGHRPMQHGTSYGIDAAYPDSLQPALLRVYRWVSSRWHDFLEQPRRLLEGTDPGVQVPARQRNVGMKRYNHDADDELEPKRFRMSDIPQDDVARPIRTSGILASALFVKDRHTSNASTTVDRNFWHTGSSYQDTPRRRPHTAGFFREQRRLVLEGVRGEKKRKRLGETLDSYLDEGRDKRSCSLS